MHKNNIQLKSLVSYDGNEAATVGITAIYNQHVYRVHRENICQSKVDKVAPF